MMRRIGATAVLVMTAAGLGLLGGGLPAQTTAGVRGKVIDEQGQPIEGVKLDFDYKGESRVKITKSQTTDKKGGFVRMGIPAGRWQITFSKEGYKTYVMETDLSLGFSEIGDIRLRAAASAAEATPAEPAAAVLPATPEASKAGEAYALALEAARAGRYDEAEPALKEIVAQFPDLSNAHYNLGYVYQMKKDWKAAEAEYLRVTELEPTKSDAHIALAAVRELDMRSPEAAEGLLAAAPVFEQDARFQYALGITCTNAGKAAEAEAAFQKAAVLDPANPEPVFQLATIAVGKNKVSEAVTLLEKYLGMSGQVPANLETAKGLLAALDKKRK